MTFLEIITYPIVLIIKVYAYWVTGKWNNK